MRALAAQARARPAADGRRCTCARKQPAGRCKACGGGAARIARKPTGPAVLSESRKAQVMAVLRAPGRPLDPGVRAELEPRFRRGFADVRVHADGQAGASALSLGAAAYTVGRHIVFAPGRYAPGNAAGRGLIAHELAHVVQQEHAGPIAPDALALGPSDDALEREADRAAALVTAGAAAPALQPGPAAPVVQRKACGPNVTAEIKSTWEQIQTDFRRWPEGDRDKACSYLVKARVKDNPDDDSLIPDTSWNVDAFDTIPLFHLTGRFWLLNPTVVAAGCGVPTATNVNDANEYERADLCSMSVQVKDTCWLSGTVNYGTFGIMCRLCKEHSIKYAGIYAMATALLYAYKVRIFSSDATTKENDIAVPHSWFKATYENGPGGTPPGKGNRSDCGCTCPLTGSIITWDYVWEPVKRRLGPTAAKKVGPVDLTKSGNNPALPAPAPSPPPPPAGRRR